MNFRNSLTLLLLFVSWPATSQAYCRTRTCDVDNSCEREDGCSIGGKKAHWPNGCLTFAIQSEGSALQDISPRDAAEVAEDAFALWTNSECHRGGSPPLTFMAQDEVSCHVPEFNCDPKDWNSNVIMFQDEGWPHGPGTVALTCVTMNLDTGEILDADMEINTTPPSYDFALPGDPEGTDLHMVITHEAGHFLGLNHSTFEGAVMWTNYTPGLLSALSDDDIAGICDIYGGKDRDPECSLPELPSDTDCVGASGCVPMPVEDPGCSCRQGAPPGRWGGGALLALLAGVAIAKRRRAHITN